MVARWSMALIAVAGRMQSDPIVARSSELMRLGLMPSAQELRGGLVRCILFQVILITNGPHASSLPRIC